MATSELAQPAGNDAAAAGVGPDIGASRDLGRLSQLVRIGFAAVYAAVSLTVLPWPVAAIWLGAVIVWEAISSPTIDWAVRRLSPRGCPSISTLFRSTSACSSSIR